MIQLSFEGSRGVLTLFAHGKHGVPFLVALLNEVAHAQVKFAAVGHMTTHGQRSEVHASRIQGFDSTERA